jgi:hypothetical protein
VPRSPQGRPVIFQAGDSDEGREFAASSADVIFSRHSTREAGQAFFADVKGRLGRYGRTHDELLIMPAATFVIGDTDAEAAELAHEVRMQQVSGQTAIRFLEQLWNRDLSDLDPDGPLPEVDPVVGENTVAKGRASVRMHRDPLATAAEWRELAEAKQLSIRELVVEVTGRQSFIGSAATVADTIDDFVQSDAADGFVLVPHITPGGLDPFVDRVVPLLQERGAFRTEYQGTTLRDHLGLVESLGLRLQGTGRQEHAGVAAVGGPLLELGEHPPGQSPAAVRRRRPHPLDLGGPGIGMPSERAPGDGYAVLEQQDQLAVRRQELRRRIAGQLLRGAAEEAAVARVVLDGELGEQRAGQVVVRVHADDLEPGCGRHAVTEGGVRDMRKLQEWDGRRCAHATATCRRRQGRRGGMRSGGAAGDRRTGQREVSDRGRCWCGAGRPSGDRRDRATGCA